MSSILEGGLLFENDPIESLFTSADLGGNTQVMGTDTVSSFLSHSMEDLDNKLTYMRQTSLPQNPMSPAIAQAPPRRPSFVGVPDQPVRRNSYIPNNADPSLQRRNSVTNMTPEQIAQMRRNSIQHTNSMEQLNNQRRNSYTSQMLEQQALQQRRSAAMSHSDVPARRNSYAASMEASLNLFDPANIQSPFDADPSLLSNTYANEQAAIAAKRRKSLADMRAASVTPEIPVTPPTFDSSQDYQAPQRRHSVASPSTPGARALDANAAKSKLADLLCSEKTIEGFGQQMINFICSNLKMHLAGFYYNTTRNFNTKDWTLIHSYPNGNTFGQFFHFSLGSRQIMQAAAEKRCFCVHNTALKNSDSLSFMFVPLPVEEGRKFSLGVIVLGAILTNEQELHNHLLFLDQLRRAVYIPFLSLNSLQDKQNLMQGLDVLLAENQILKKKHKFERAVVQVLATVENTHGKRISIICSNTAGLITYVSPGAEQMLGYNSNELVGVQNLLKIHEPNEIISRTRELELEVRKRVAPGMAVLVARTMKNRGQDDTRIWTYLKKDGTPSVVTVTIKPLFDEKSVFGFVEIASEMDLTSQLNTDEFFATEFLGQTSTPKLTPSLSQQNLTPNSAAAAEEELIKSILADNQTNVDEALGFNFN